MKPIEQREQEFKAQINALDYPQSMKDEFFAYWSEPNKSGTKMRFELEKTWHLGRRAARWANNNFGNKPVTQKLPVMKQKQPETELERLDAFLAQYRQHPTSIPFASFAQWYDYLREKKLLRPFTRTEVDNIKAVYGEDKQKCRSAAVQMTFDDYGKSGWTFTDTMKVKGQLA